MNVGIMQPYFFPYLGYFQLISAVDIFIFADDVNYIKNGFINRNNILLNNEKHLITIPCYKASQNKLIKEVEIATFMKGYPHNILNSIKHAYRKAPYFDQFFPVIESVLKSNDRYISELASRSVEAVTKYLNLKTDFKYSSNNYGHTKGLERSKRIISIMKELNSSNYFNLIRGQMIYDKDFFKEHGIELSFIESHHDIYPQFNNDFVRNLSIIDVLMFNSIEETGLLLNQYHIL